MMDRTGSVAGGIEGAHQLARVRRGVWVRGHQTTDGADPAMHVAGLLLRAGGREQRARVRVGELGATLVEPVPELGGVVQVEPVEQRSGVELHDALPLAR